MSISDETVCYCADVSRATIVDAIRHGASTLKDVQLVTSAGIGNRCKELNPKGVCCHSDIRAVLEAETGSQEDSAGCSCGSCGPGSPS